MEGENEEDGVEFVRGLADLNVADMKPLELPKLEWVNFDKEPSRLMVSNTGQTVALTPKFTSEDLPYVEGGPISQGSARYQFAQINFTWGPTVLDGTDHTIDSGHRLPMEMHLLLRNDTFENLEMASSHPAGVIELVYFFLISPTDNPTLQVLIEKFPKIQSPGTWAYFNDAPDFLDQLIYKFTDDYFLYWSTFRTPICQHSVMILVTREISYISAGQLEAFRQLMRADLTPISGNTGLVIAEPGTDSKGKVCHVNPAGKYTNTTLRVGSIRVANELATRNQDTDLRNYCNFSEYVALLEMNQRVCK
jgi:carbonic anhydrase